MTENIMEILATVFLPFAWIAFLVILVMLLLIIIFSAVWRTMEGSDNA